MSKEPLYPHVPKSRKAKLEARVGEGKGPDLREDYDEKAEVLDGTLYRKGNIVQVWWSDGTKETWTSPDAANAQRNFQSMKERWSANPQAYAKVWNVIDKEKLRKYCEEVWGVPVTTEASDYLGRLLARRVDQFKSYLPLPFINRRGLTARDMYRAASALFD